MADPFRQELETIRQLNLQAREALDSNVQGSRERAHELLVTSVTLCDDLLAQSPAAALGSKGGKSTAAKKGPGYFAELAGKRKTKAGGRPKKASREH